MTERVKLEPGTYSLGDLFTRARERYWAVGGWDKDPEPRVSISFIADGFGTDVSFRFFPREGEEQAFLFSNVVVEEL